MRFRVLFAVAAVALVATQTESASPIGWGRDWRRGTQRAATPNPASGQSIDRKILRSPEQMTIRFGRSILMREPAVATKSPRFVSQPE